MATTATNQHESPSKASGIPRPTSLVASGEPMVNKHQQRKAAKTKRNELRLVLQSLEPLGEEETPEVLQKKRSHKKSSQKHHRSTAIITTTTTTTWDTHKQHNGGLNSGEWSAAAVLARLGVTLANNKENVMDEPKEEDEKTRELTQCKEHEESEGAEGVEEGKMSSCTQTQQHSNGAKSENLSSLYHGTWPVERSLWHSGPSSIGGTRSVQQDVSSVMSFTSSVGSGSGGLLLPNEVAAARRTYSQQQLGAKVEMVYSLLSMLGTHDREDMSRTLLAMSSSPDSCAAMRQSGCLPLLVQLLHAPDSDADTRQRAAQALHNMVHSHPDDKRGRREARVLRLLEQIREYCDVLREAINSQQPNSIQNDMERHPGPTIAALMKLSFDEEHRHAMCQLGGLHAIAELIQVDHEAHGSTTGDQYCVTLRRYAGMALTNLTFGDGANKALLCSFRPFMRALVAQLKSPSEDLRQVTASVLRNLSWRADGASKQTLREVGAVTGLMRAAMEGKKESTLKSILSALWNLSAHCSMNKVDICAVEGALGFLVDMLSYKAPSKTLAIVENAGGILRNISSHIAVREDYRAILREHNCLQVLLQQLKSPSLTVVSNACGTLWNLSARCAEDQRALWEMGAASMLRSLVHSKHKMISMGSSAALKNLLSARPGGFPPPAGLSGPSATGGLGLPGLYARKQRALEQELDQTLAETCENIEPSTSPSSSTILRDEKFVFSATEQNQRTGGGSFDRQHISRMFHSQASGRHQSRGAVARSDSRDSVTSTLSDTVYERVSRTVLNLLASPTATGLTGSISDSGRINAGEGSSSDRHFLHRYCNTMRQRQEEKNAEGSGDDDTDQQHREEPDKQSSSQATVAAAAAAASAGTYHDAVKSTAQDSIESRLASTQIVDQTHTSSSSAVKQSTKNILYEGTRSAFNPIVPAGVFGSAAHRGQFLRTKYSDLAYDDDAEAQEQPVDYSLKYVEEQGLTVSDKPDDDRGKQTQNDLGRGYPPFHHHHGGTSKNMKLNVVYGDYAETDLDQPTDYSLKYAEEDEEEAEAEYRKNEVESDTLKTYCTEGTPYETPYNFSTATSMSDLRCEQPKSEKSPENYAKDESLEHNVVKNACEDSDIVKVVDTSNLNKGFEEKSAQVKSLPPTQTSTPRQPIMSPEKPVQYCEEDTPACFSRMSSLSSLSSAAAVAQETPAEAEGLMKVTPIDKQPLESPEAAGPKVEEQQREREGKVVTFGGADHYAEETPLMFSRCSSLGSLSSFEQHSIHDDRSSVISDFSRRTSGIVSPSELPDSPTQTVPASPRSTKPPVEFINRLPEDSRAIRSQPAGRQAAGRNGAVGGAMKSSVFEDEVVAFKVEDTPFEFSRATSLSSLSIDDEPKISNDAMLKEVVGKQRVVGTVPIPAGIHHHQQQHRMTEEGMEKQDTEKEKRGELADCCELPPVSEGEEENDEDMLAACITIGMQNSRQRQQNQYSNRRDKIAPLCGPQPPAPNRLQQTASRGATTRPSGIPVKSITPNNSQRQGKQRLQHTDPRGKPINYMEIGGGPCEDTVRTYCTEGTPANISHAGSHSDLSVLSLAGDGDEIELAAKKTGEDESRPPELSDDSSNLSGDNDNILAECIQSGMPKARSPMVRRTVAQPSDPGKATATPIAPAVNVAVLPSRRPSRPPAHHLCSLDHYRPSQSPPGRNRRASPPHSKQQVIKDSTAKLNRAQNLAAHDELETYATEGSPNTFSTRSSLSDLTINSTEVATLASNLNRNAQQAPPLSEATSREHPVNYNVEDASLEFSHTASFNSLTLEEDHYSEGPKLSAAAAAAATATAGGAGVSDLEPPAALINKAAEEGQAMTASDGSWGDKSHKVTSCSVSEDVVTVLSRNGSLSSLSVDSFGSTEPSEQALLEQCISSGMPKSRTEHQSAAIAKPRIPVPVSASAKRKVPGSKIPHAISSMPIPKLELKPSALKSYRSEGVAGVEREMACLSLYDVQRSCDDQQIPKNGVESSAAMQEKIAAGEADANTAADSITKGNFPQDQVLPMENNQHLEEEQEMERGYLHAPAISSENVSNAERNEECIVKETKQTKTNAPCSKNDTPNFHSDIRSPLSPLQNQDQSPESRIHDWRKDPDAMIASLDRLTEELVQQAQDLHEQKEKNKEGAMKQSAVGSDTWNEDTSPNDVSFPSMSISAPLVASFRSDNLEDPAATGGLGNLTEEEPQDSSPGGLPDLVEEVAELPDASPSGVPNLVEEEVLDAPDPHLLELEARKLAVAVQAEGLNLPSMEHSLTSLNSVDIDAIKPPSMMGSLVSLTTSLSGQLENPEYGIETLKGEQGSSPMPQSQARSNGSGRLECRHTRKKSLPLGMMVRRALGNSNSAHNGSTENLQNQQDSISSSCNSHLDNIKPPSAMEDAIDVADMENSMVSVASITSEVADASSAKEHSNSDQNSDGAFDLLRPAASIMADVYAAQYPAAAAAMTASRSASDCIDNINPPSAFNEIADLGDVEESAAEPGTETICSDTEMCTEEPGYAHSMERLDEAPDLPPDNCTGSRKSTPVPQTSDQSSAESTPKKHPQRQQLTPKQRRQLVKERYKTYTIAGEEAEKANIVADDQGLNEPSQEDKELKDKAPNKITPKQRRQEDRQRFQTRILDKSPIIDVKSVAEPDIAETEATDCIQEMPSRPEDANYERVDIRDRGTKTLKQKRAEAKERFRTHTLKDESRPQMTLNVTSNHDICQEVPSVAQVIPLTGPGFVEALLNVTPEEIESILEHDANIVITTINNSRQESELPNSEDMLLECETLSLISIESESEHNSNTYRVTGRRRGSDIFLRENSLSDRDKENNVTERMHEEMEDLKVSVENSEESDEEDEAAQLAKGPRIVKPEERQARDGSAGSGSAGDDGMGSQTNSPKAIRGRRKALYSSPASKRGTTQSPTSRMAAKSRSSIPVVSSVSASNVRATRASELRQTGQRSTSRTPPSSAESRSPRNASPKTASRLAKKPVSSPPPKTTTTAKNTTSSKCGAAETEEVADPRFKPPERQGTFTKDDSSMPNAPQVQTPPSPSRTKIPVPASVLKADSKNKKAPVSSKGSIPAARARVRKDTSAPSLTTKTSGQGRPPRTQGMEINSSGNLKSLTKAATIPGRNGTIQPSAAARLVGNKRRSMGTLEGMKTSLSNQSLHSSDGKTTGRQHPSTPPQRSNSNCSINSVSLGKKTKKEVTSKIASLWKRVEESKTKQKNAKKDTRVWISGAESNGENDGKCAPTSRLVRSSTFEGLPSKVKPEQNVAEEAAAAVVQQASNTQKLVAEVVSVQSREQEEVVRRQHRPASEELNNPKRLSRLGSFIRIEGEGNDSKAPKPTASAVVPPFNYNPPVTVATTPSSHIPTLVTKRSVSYVSGMSDGHTEEISTASMRVTTV